MRRPPHLTSVAAIASFDGAGRDLVLGLKYANRRDALPWMARQLVRIAPADIDLVTHVPTTVSRRGRRGFDQAAALTRAMRAELGKLIVGQETVGFCGPA